MITGTKARWCILLYFVVLFVSAADASAQSETVALLGYTPMQSPSYPEQICTLSPPGCSSNNLIFTVNIPSQAYHPRTHQWFPALTATLNLNAVPSVTPYGDPQFHSWIEVRDTNCNGSLIASMDIPAGTGTVVSGYSHYRSSVEVIPGHTYSLCTHFDPQAVARVEFLDAWITGDAVIDAPPEPKVVPALSWQAEILFMACLLAVRLWKDKRLAKS